jgi:hypothetical protein
MKKAALATGVIAVLTLSSSVAQADQYSLAAKVSPGLVAAARQALIEQRQTAPEKTAAEKAVPRTDKLTVDITGAIYDGEIYSGDDGCGYRSEDLLVLYLRVKGQWVSVACAGAAFSACNSTRPGQRIRVQGTLIAAPDVLDPDFDKCDPATWFLGPLNLLLATKVTK